MDQGCSSKEDRRQPAQQALQKMGLVRDIDLALHLPLRYEDETRIVPLKNARDGETVQIEATVTHSEVQLRPGACSKVTVDDGSSTCLLTFFSFYPSQQRPWRRGAPAFAARSRAVSGAADDAPCIPGGGRRAAHGADTGLSSHCQFAPGLSARRAIASALLRADLSETLPPGAVASHCAVLWSKWTAAGI